ncbi:hypothetical protein [Calothrix sp. NIES-3974]|uniref:hypothetical protein n=1 Tax=Calothrix sp. NIES-3974 TaxID=2005462 RepID=UPI000B5E6ACD|nr:hypothetical protein [Calothrix sp. NIES-3974]BAZ05951.1 hypothetical protein NIES3974_26080 [Calothrix sp. NIES-3974]
MGKTIDRLLKPDLVRERLESLKAGVFAAIAVVCTHWLISLLMWGFSSLGYNLELGNSGFLTRFQVINTLLGSTFALFSGFLFGVTYRYIVREDTNFHLETGAIAAFALVRGMAQLEVVSQNWLSDNQQSTLLSSLWFEKVNLSIIFLIFGESFLWFAAARLILDWAMKQGWLKRFSQ